MAVLLARILAVLPCAGMQTHTSVQEASCQRITASLVPRAVQNEGHPTQHIKGSDPKPGQAHQKGPAPAPGASAGLPGRTPARPPRTPPPPRRPARPRPVRLRPALPAQRSLDPAHVCVVALLKNQKSEFRIQKSQSQNTQAHTQNSELRTQTPDLSTLIRKANLRTHTQNSELTVSEYTDSYPKLRTQNSSLRRQISAPSFVRQTSQLILRTQSSQSQNTQTHTQNSELKSQTPDLRPPCSERRPRPESAEHSGLKKKLKLSTQCSKLSELTCSDSELGSSEHSKLRAQNSYKLEVGKPWCSAATLDADQGYAKLERPLTQMCMQPNNQPIPVSQ